ncbi:threonine--tRNA ligase [Desulfovibrio sp. OttesenSCG-928-A18]|nr:threonine--tRNA ligase [Desulfovibrio sp. OttesenSCG-928-A18]
MNISIEGNSIDLAPGASCGEALKAALSGKRYKSCVAARAGDLLLDLAEAVPAAVFEGGERLEPVSIDSDAGLEILRHSAAHVMACAVQRLFPKARVSIGPAIEKGFYYDFDPPRPFGPDDFAAIEAEMRHIAAAAVPFARRELDREEAIRFFEQKGENYKVEILRELEADRVSLYELAEFTDLCRGPHLPHSGFVRAFKLLSVAGAYWRGDEKNKMLSRIYGTAFAEESELKTYLHRLEEARRRDHRKLGRELDLFDFHEDVAPGMVFWHPRGMLVRTILEDFLRKEHLKRGYELVQGPQLLRRELWEKSGHYDNYRENMYFTEIEGDAYGIKPMNCLAHMLIYGSALRSYRELPVRYCELGVVHRHEMSGALHGLLRVRQFTQDDAHIICRPDQLEEEIIGIISLVRDLFNLFGFSYKLGVATRPEKFIGTIEAWDRATAALIQALERLGLPYLIYEGDGAFYGPKIDGRVTDSLEREWQLSTIQCDFTLPERFDLSYIATDGEKHRPVMLHRAILGSLERFIGILIEHTAGAFPTWLAPEQARVVTVTEKHDEFARQVEKTLNAAGVRARADLRNEKLGYKVRAAQLEKIPYVLVIGDKEVESAGVNVRLRGGETLGHKEIAEVIALIQDDSAAPFKQGGMNYRFA